MSTLEVLLKRLSIQGTAKRNLLGIPSAAGADNQVTFYQTADITCTCGFAPQNSVYECACFSYAQQVKLAVSVRREEDQSLLDEAKQAHELLLKKNVNAQYFQTFLWFNNKGERVSLCASEGSLADYLAKLKAKRKKLTYEQIKNILCQIIFAIDELHTKDLVHRDIKPGNILVTTINNTLVVQLADLDTLAEVTPEGFPTNKITLGGGTYEYATPAIQKLLVKNKRELYWHQNDITPYKEINLKSADLYAIGLVLDELIQSAEPIKQNDPLIKLQQVLTASTSNYASQIESIRKFFSEKFISSKDLQARMNELPSTFVDHYRARTYVENDNFLLLNKELKTIYRLGEQLDSKFRYFDLIDENHEDFDSASFNALLQNWRAFREERDRINRFANLSVISECKETLSALFNTVDNRFKFIAQQYVKKSGKFELIAEFSVNEYIRVNKLDQPRSFFQRLFSLHGETGKLRAEEFQKQLESTELLPSEKLRKIRAFILNPKNGRLSGTSFKAILAKNIGTLLNLSSDFLEKMDEENLKNKVKAAIYPASSSAPQASNASQSASSSSEDSNAYQSASLTISSRL